MTQSCKTYSAVRLRMKHLWKHHRTIISYSSFNPVKKKRNVTGFWACVLQSGFLYVLFFGAQLLSWWWVWCQYQRAEDVQFCLICLVFFLSVRFRSDKSVTAQIHTHTRHKKAYARVLTLFLLDIVLLFRPFLLKNKILSPDLKPPCLGRSAAPAIGHGRSTGLIRLISLLRWWGWLSQVTK